MAFYLSQAGGGGLTPKFQEFNSSGTFSPPQALIDAGGYIEVFLVGGGSARYVGGEVLTKRMYLTSTSGVSVTIGAGGSRISYPYSGGNSSFNGSSAGGSNITAKGANGLAPHRQIDSLGAGWAAYATSGYFATAGGGVFGYGAGAGDDLNNNNQLIGGVHQAKANSGQGGSPEVADGGSGYCLVKWYE